jgi:hypothetical protein
VSSRWIVATLVVSSAQAQFTHLWHFEGQLQGATWRSIALGANGSQLVSNPEGGSGAVALFTGADAPTAPLIWADNTSAQARTGLVRAAAATDTYANLYFEAPSGGSPSQFVPKLSLRHSSSPSAAWTRTFAATNANTITLPCGLHVADDGSKILAWWYDNAQTKTYIVGYTGAGDVLFASSVTTYIAPQASATDSTCRRLFLGLQQLTMVVDGTSGTLVKTLEAYSNPTSAICVGPNSDSVAIGNTGGAVDVYRTGTQILGHACTIPATPTMMPRNAAFSRDGSVLVVGYQSNADTQSIALRFFDCAGQTATQVHQHALHGTGQYPCIFTDIVTSNTGGTIVASTSGDQNHTLPSILVFSRNATGYELTQSATLAGSAYDIDLSPDARLVAVAGSASHYASATYTIGVVDAFDLGGDLSDSGVPHAGTSVQVEQKSTPGAPCLLLVSDSLAATPTTFGGMGSLLLQAPVRLATTIADGVGTAHFDFTLPAGAGAYGHTYYTQGLTLIQRKFTSSYVPITVVP